MFIELNTTENEKTTSYANIVNINTAKMVISNKNTRFINADYAGPSKTVTVFVKESLVENLKLSSKIVNPLMFGGNKKVTHT